MKNKIIAILFISLLILAIIFQAFKLKTEREKSNNLEQENRIFERQIEYNSQDLIKYKKEKEENEKTIRIQQKKILASKSSKCLDEPLPDDILAILCETGINFNECPNT